MKKLVEYHLDYAIISNAINVEKRDDYELDLAIKHCKVVANNTSISTEARDAKAMLKILKELEETYAKIDELKICFRDLDMNQFAKKMKVHSPSHKLMQLYRLYENDK